MLATCILGAVSAFFVGLGLRNIYRNFFKGESTCCGSGSGGCAGCTSCHRPLESYRSRMERIDKFERVKSIDVAVMTCENCVAHVIKALEQVDGVEVAAASLEKGSAAAALSKAVPDEILLEAIRKAGYRPGACSG